MYFSFLRIELMLLVCHFAFPAPFLMPSVHQNERVVPCGDGGIDVTRRADPVLKIPDIRVSEIFGDSAMG